MPVTKRIVAACKTHLQMEEVVERVLQHQGEYPAQHAGGDDRIQRRLAAAAQ